MRTGIGLAVALALLPQQALADESFIVKPEAIAGEKAVFATTPISCRREHELAARLFSLQCRGAITLRRIRWWRSSRTRSSRCR